MTLAEIKRMNPVWFGGGNKAFFNDVSYKACNQARFRYRLDREHSEEVY